jgi:arylsulfatase
MAKRHLAFKQKYPDRPPVYDIPYKGIANLRPESIKAVEIFMLGLPQK